MTIVRALFYIRRRAGHIYTAAGLCAMALLLQFLVVAPSASAAELPAPGGTAWVGRPTIFNGTAFLFPIYSARPADPSHPGEPDYWANCIEHHVD